MVVESAGAAQQAAQGIGQGVVLTVSGALNFMMMAIVSFAVWSMKKFMTEVKDSITTLGQKVGEFELAVAKNYATKDEVAAVTTDNKNSHEGFWKEIGDLKERVAVAETRIKDANE